MGAAARDTRLLDRGAASLAWLAITPEHVHPNVVEPFSTQPIAIVAERGTAIHQ